jgi:catechol 2,3-dioxygenase-like lactoylglutathione lyase family enzyme
VGPPDACESIVGSYADLRGLDLSTQLTPPGSACSIAFGEGTTEAVPGSVQGMQVVVADVAAAHDEHASRGVDVSDVEDLAWGSFVYFRDPDGNAWGLRRLPSRA